MDPARVVAGLFVVALAGVTLALAGVTLALAGVTLALAGVVSRYVEGHAVDERVARVGAAITLFVGLSLVFGF